MGRLNQSPSGEDEILLGENLKLLPRFADGSFQLIYIDPPFNTGASRTRRTLAAVRDEDGRRTGFQGRRYSTSVLATSSYRDRYEDYLAFLAPRLEHSRRLLAREGTLYFHIDYREAHYCKLLLDDIFGRACFLNEIIWAYDYGARTRRRWPAKHDTILVYVRDPEAYHPSITRRWTASPTWPRAWSPPRRPHWASCRPTSGGTRSSPRRGGRDPATRRRSRSASSVGWSSHRPDPGDWCLDFFAGSGTLGAAAAVSAAATCS